MLQPNHHLKITMGSRIRDTHVSFRTNDEKIHVELLQWKCQTVVVCTLNKVSGFDLRRSCAPICTWTYKLSNFDFRPGIESQKHLYQYYYYTMLINEIGL